MRVRHPIFSNFLGDKKCLKMPFYKGIVNLQHHFLAHLGCFMQQKGRL